MTEERLATDLWVKAHLRRCHAAAIPVVVARSGDPEYGVVILKINQFENGCRVLTQARDAEGRLGWLAAFDGAPVPEAEADSYIARTVDRDPDLWVIEIESRAGDHPFDGRMI